MSEKHPYVPTPSYMSRVITQLRKSFPNAVNAATLKKLGFPSQESYVLNVMRFLGMIDVEGKKTQSASKVFLVHDDAEFSSAFEKLVIEAYQDLFDLHGANAWDLSTDVLITFFRTSDETTELVGKLQAQTFKLLSAHAGHGEVPMSKPTNAKTSPSPANKQSKKSKNINVAEFGVSALTTDSAKAPKNFGLTVRIEINLPIVDPFVKTQFGSKLR